MSKKQILNVSIAGLILAAAFGIAHAGSEPAPKEGEVKKDLESILAECEKKKLPPDQEIDCIEQGYLKFMGVETDDESK